MAATNEPRMEPHFKINRWNENTVDQIRTELRNAISGDSGIADASSIDLEVVTSGAEVERIRLVGSVRTEDERHRAARIVSVNTHDEVTVQNDLETKMGD